MPIDNVYMLNDVQLVASGEAIENVYFFSNDGAGGSAESLAQAFQDDILALILDCQAASVSHRIVQVRSLGNPADYFEVALSGVIGSNAGDALSAFTALNFTLRPASRVVRPGSKRISGLPDVSSLYTDGVVVNATFISTINLLRIALGTQITELANTYTPVIVKRVFVPADEPEHGAYYRLPVDDEELVMEPVANVLSNLRLTHQVSRGNSR